MVNICPSVTVIVHYSPTLSMDCSVEAAGPVCIKFYVDPFVSGEQNIAKRITVRRPSIWQKKTKKLKIILSESKVPSVPGELQLFRYLICICFIVLTGDSF